MFPHDLDRPISRRAALGLGGGVAVSGALAGSPLAAEAAASAVATASRRRRVKQSGKLPADAMQQILQAEGTVSKGVLSIDISRDDIGGGKVRGPLGVDRRDRIVIGDVQVSPGANISTGVELKPVGHHGEAYVAPDFSLTSREAQPVIALMRRLGWFVSCLYNQETAESPQLYFAHMLKRGDAYALAEEVRRGLDLTASD